MHKLITIADTKRRYEESKKDALLAKKRRVSHECDQRTQAAKNECLQKMAAASAKFEASQKTAEAARKAADEAAQQAYEAAKKAAEASRDTATGALDNDIRGVKALVTEEQGKIETLKGLMARWQHGTLSGRCGASA